VARASLTRRALAAAGLACLAGFAYAHRGDAELWMAHAHNLIALAMWTFFFRRDAGGARAGRARHVALPVAFVVLSALFFLLPLPDLSMFAGVDPAVQELVLSPVSSPSLAPRFVAFFAFAQSVHYAVWVRSVPDEARPRGGIRSFASSMRALRLDVGGVVLAASVLAFFGILAWALVDLDAARVGYFRLALSHGYLELAVAGLCVLERRALA